jgi:hypothetical protein
LKDDYKGFWVSVDSWPDLLRRHRTIAEQRRIGWEMAVRIEKLIPTVLDEAHERQVEEKLEILSEEPEGFYR